MSGAGPIAKFFSEEAIKLAAKTCNIQAGDSLFFSCADKKEVERISGLARQKIAEELDMIDKKKLNLVTILFLCLKQAWKNLIHWSL